MVKTCCRLLNSCGINLVAIILLFPESGLTVATDERLLLRCPKIVSSESNRVEQIENKINKIIFDFLSFVREPTSSFSKKKKLCYDLK